MTRCTRRAARRAPAGADVKLTESHVTIEEVLTNEDGQRAVESDYELPAAQ